VRFIARRRAFFLGVAVLTVLFGIELHRSEQPVGNSSPSLATVSTDFRRDDLTPQNRARCPEGALSSAGMSPKKIADVKPVYPDAARELGISGVVIVQVLIDQRGDVAAAQVIRSLPPLDKAALDAVRQWKYAPITLNGETVCVGMTVPVDVKPS
jgi:TonB family protein